MQYVALAAELHQMNVENQHLTDLLDRLRISYKELEQRVVRLKQKQNSQAKTTVPGWISNKVPRVVSDQASESMMKKARVSVRAKSEASMVSVTLINCSCSCNLPI